MTMSLERLFGLTGKLAVVTGGSRGIGAMITRGLLEAGCKVIISARKADQIALAEKEFAALGWCKGFAADLSTVDGCQALAAFVRAEFGRLDILVNNAGATWGASFESFTEDAWDKVMDTNVKGPFFLSQAMLPLLAANGTPDDPSRIINVGSIDGLTVSPVKHYPYSASKAGIHHLTRALAKDLGPNITVNAIAPGPFESKMMAATLASKGDAIADGAPLKRIGRPDDMAGVAIYLASRAGAYVTGAVIPVDGGIATTA
jgi:NAD(P)-dependent dehydrogenase (short-subunit alcohol dehydrogenase family)